jgi:tRNA threonylcarbamoyladenosine biosynthesis protein TsaB
VSFHLLSVDATGEWGSIALVNARGVLEEVTIHAPDGFAHVLFGEMEQLLARHGLIFERLDGFASASGPGSFTGVRVGLTAMKGLAEATGRKVVAVSNLRALASYGTRALRAVVMDARRGEVYGGVYDAALEPVCGEVVAKLPLWLASLPEGDLEFITQGFPLASSGITAPVVEAPRALAGAIGKIALPHFLRGEALDPAEIDANYVRRSDAELLWKDPAQKGA